MYYLCVFYECLIDTLFKKVIIDYVNWQINQESIFSLNNKYANTSRFNKNFLIKTR